MKKILSAILVLAMVATMAIAFSSCKNSTKDFKIGVILLHDENSTYDNNFINSVKAAVKELKLKDNQLVLKRNIPESNDCYEAAADLVDEGCKVIFADSFGHEEFMIKAAKEFKDVQFCHATGTRAHTEGLDNFHNAFASIYEGRYLAGIAAGLKLKEMINAGKFTEKAAKIGYVGAFTYAEVISGYTAFFLGAREICPEVTMEVQFTGSWYDETAEKNTAEALINNGCKLISGHADSMGAPTACEEKKVPNIAYNGSTVESCPETFIVSSRIDWAPYFQYICQQVIDGKEIDTDWTGTLVTKSVALTDINTKAAAADTAATIEKYRKELESGERHVFDTSKFTVAITDAIKDRCTVDENGHLTSYKADVDTDAAFTPDTEVVSNGYFHESEKRSAPYFDVEIEGITLLNRNYGD